MRPLVTLVSGCFLLTACATQPEGAEPPELFLAANPVGPEKDIPFEIVEMAVPLPLPGQLIRVSDDGPGARTSSPAMPPAEALRRAREGAVFEPTADGFVNAVQVYPYTEGALYRLYASPGQVSAIALQPGEALVSVSAGDTVRWVLGDTRSGSGTGARVHILVKPVSAGIRTNLMIATDRRTYHLELEAATGGYMAALSWRYPADELSALKASNAEARMREANVVDRDVRVEGLNFDYKLSGSDPDWKPVRVFDDGRQVFIYYVVDRLFRAAELRLGERNQTVVRISRNERRSPLAAIFGD